MIASDVPNGKIFRVIRNGKVFKMLNNRGQPYVEVEESPDDHVMFENPRLFNYGGVSL